MAICTECGNYFPATAAWQKVCKPCYKLRKQDELNVLVEQRDYYKQHAMDRDYWRRRTASLSAAASISVLHPDMVKRLLQLVHPDKHGGSEAATKATAWLLGLRDRVREDRA